MNKEDRSKAQGLSKDSGFPFKKNQFESLDESRRNGRNSLRLAHIRPRRLASHDGSTCSFTRHGRRFLLFDFPFEDQYSFQLISIFIFFSAPSILYLPSPSPSLCAKTLPGCSKSARNLPPRRQWRRRCFTPGSATREMRCRCVSKDVFVGGVSFGSSSGSCATKEGRHRRFITQFPVALVSSADMRLFLALLLVIILPKSTGAQGCEKGLSPFFVNFSSPLQSKKKNS